MFINTTTTVHMNLRALPIISRGEYVAEHRTLYYYIGYTCVGVTVPHKSLSIPYRMAAPQQ